MDSRERVLASLNHSEPDRVPIDIGGGVSTSMVAEVYEKLKLHLGIPGTLQYLSFFYRVARLDENALVYLNSDCCPLISKRYSQWNPPGPKETKVKDIWGITWKKVLYGAGHYWEVIESPLSESDIDEINKHPWPDPLDKGLFENTSSEAQKLYNETTYAIVGDGGFKSFWELAYMLRGFDNLLIDVVANPEYVIELLTKLLAINSIATERFLDAAGPYIQVFRMGDDLATQNGLIMSPQSFRSVIKPFYKKYIELIKSKTNAKVFFHSCGNITDLLDDLIEVGVDIINPVQGSALKTLSDLKIKYAKQLTFWGAIDTQHVLPFGSSSDVENEVKDRISDLAAGGGFVLSAVHAIQPDVPIQNIIAMRDAALKYGSYNRVI